MRILVNQQNSIYRYSKPNSFNADNCVAYKPNYSDNFNKVAFKGKNYLTYQMRLLKILNNLSINLTPLDTTEIKAIRSSQLNIAETMIPTIRINTPERAMQREDIINRLLSSARPDRGRKGFIVTGLPGSGKSTLSKRLAHSNSAFHLDLDEIKFAIPEFKQNPLTNYAIKDEAKYIRNNMFESLTDKGCNVILEVIGESRLSLFQSVKKMRSKGYSIHLRLVTLPKEQAFQRVMQRFRETGRFTDPLFHILYDKIPQKNYNNLVKWYYGYLDSYHHYTSNVSKGEPFRLIS